MTVGQHFGFGPCYWRGSPGMPFRLFLAYDALMGADLIRRRNAQARAEWNARIEAMKRREGRGM